MKKLSSLEAISFNSGQEAERLGTLHGTESGNSKTNALALMIWGSLHSLTQLRPRGCFKSANRQVYALEICMFVPIILCAVPLGSNGKEIKRGLKKGGGEGEKGWESKVEKE